MKKILLTTALAVLCGAASAQQRLSLYEEFSGENCAPCAAYNPGLWTLLSTSPNPSKVLLIKYQSPIPSAGPIYNAYKTVTNARLAYYSVPFAPYYRLDGAQQGTGNIASTTQAILNTATSVAAPFTLTASHTWTSNADQLSITVNLTALSAFAPAGANLKLRAALIEYLQYSSPPGTNGETEFHNVVREMYPSAAGTQLANSWTAGQTQTLTLTGAVPAYVNKAASGNTRVVVWVQDDNNKVVAQAGVSAYVATALDAASAALQVPASLVCTAGSVNVNPILTLQNTGTTTLTSATLYYKLDAGTWQTTPWTGSLAPNATIPVTLPALAVAPGAHIVADSIGMPNGQKDMNGANNRATAMLSVRNTTGAALPLAASFENGGAIPANWLLYDANSNGLDWTIGGSAARPAGNNGSTYSLFYDNYDYPVGEANYAIIPADNMAITNRELSFYEAYAYYTANTTAAPNQNEKDKLEVVYSTNCGATWTSIWSQSGMALATAPATTSFFVPTTTAQWRNYVVSLSAVPAGATLAFRATSDYGNNLFVDDVNLRAANPTATAPAVAAHSLTLAPNPAAGQTVLSFELTQRETVRVEVLDAVGRVVATPAVGSLNRGPQQVIIRTDGLAAGLYNVVLRTADGSVSTRLAVAN